MTFAHVFDIGAAFALAFFSLRGALRGLTGEIVSLLGLIASVMCGWMFAQPMAVALLRYFPGWTPAITELICAVVIFMGVSLLFSIVSKIMRALVRVANLTFLDHIAGAVAGGVRAFVVVLFIYGITSIFSPVIPSDWMEDSLAMQGASAVWPAVLQFMTGNGWINPDRLTSQLEALLSGVGYLKHLI